MNLLELLVQYRRLVEARYATNPSTSRDDAEKFLADAVVFKVLAKSIRACVNDQGHFIDFEGNVIRRVAGGRPWE